MPKVAHYISINISKYENLKSDTFLVLDFLGEGYLACTMAVFLDGNFLISFSYSNDPG